MDTPVTELPEGVNREVFENLETAFGDDWKHFPPEEQKRICEVVESIPPVVKSQRRAFTQEMLQNLVQVHGLIVMRGINTEPLAMLTNFAGIAAIRGSIEKFNANEANVKKVRLLTKREASLLAEVERRLPDHTKITGKRTNDELRQFTPLAVAWIRLKKKEGFANIVGKDKRDTVNMPNHRTTKPDEDNRGTAVFDLLPDDLKAILIPPPKADAKVDAEVRDVQTELRDTLEGGTGNDAGPDKTGVVFRHRGEQLGDEPNTDAEPDAEYRPETLVERRDRNAAAKPQAKQSQEVDQSDASNEKAVQSISDADRALMEASVPMLKRVLDQTALIPVGQEDSPKARTLERAAQALDAITARIAGNSAPRAQLTIGTKEMLVSDATLRRIESGSVEVVVTIREVIIRKGTGKGAAAETESA